MMMVIAASTMVACTKNADLFDSSAIEQNAKATYAENFTKKYPNVDLNQSWDYSTKQSDYRLGSGNKARTRAGEGGITKGSWYEVDNNTLSWMHEQLVEGQDNPFLYDRSRQRLHHYPHLSGSGRSHVEPPRRGGWHRLPGMGEIQ